MFLLGVLALSDVRTDSLLTMMGTMACGLRLHSVTEKKATDVDQMYHGSQVFSCLQIKGHMYQ